MSASVTLSTALNHLLSALPANEYELLMSEMDLVPMAMGKVIYEAGIELKHVYFPTQGCIVSLLYVMEDGAAAEIAVVGDEGIVGVASFLGGGATTSRAVVQSGGQAFRLDARILRAAFETHAHLQQWLLRYTQALITQMAQTAVCNRHHSLAQQLCRLLLFCLDRLPSNELRLTQEAIAHMLGVRREGVTEAAGKLQYDGVIQYSRGHITVIDRHALESRACECYSVVRKEYDRLLCFSEQTA